MRFGLSVNLVQEIIRQQALTVVPRAPETVAGLINLRGQILTIVSLYSLFESSPALAPTEQRLFLICTPRHTSVGIIIDKIGEVLTIDPAKIERSPENVQGVARELIEGTYQTEDDLILLFNVQRAMSLIVDDISN